MTIQKSAPMANALQLPFSPLEAPPARSAGAHILRPHLIRLLDENINCALSLICAPAGYGKSTLLSQWRTILGTRHLSCAFVNLNRCDNDFSLFLTNLMSALKRTGYETGDLSGIFDDGIDSVTTDAIARKVIAALENAPYRLVLIFDDYQNAQSQQADDFMIALLSYRTAKLHVVVSSRERPQINSGNLLADHQSIEISASDLKFSPEETLNALGCDARASDTLTNDVARRIDGWPVAVQFAKLLNGSAEDLSQAISSLSGSQGSLADYFSNQVMSGVPSQVQDVFYKTSVFETFNLELAELVCDNFESGAFLKQIEAFQGLAVLEKNDATYGSDSDEIRYHPLFAEYLQGMLHKKHGRLSIALRLKAAHWLFSNGRFAQAIRQASLAGNHDLCIAFIGEAGGWKLGDRYGTDFLSDLLFHIPDAKVAGHPQVLFAKCYAAAGKGDLNRAQGYFKTATDALTQGNSAPEAISAKHAAALQLTMHKDDFAAPGQYVKAIPVQLEVAFNDPVLTGVAHLCCSARRAALGQFDLAKGQADKAMRSFAQGDAPLGVARASVQSGLIEFYSGRRRAAESDFSAAQEILSTNNVEDRGLEQITELCLGALRYWGSGLDERATTKLKTLFLTALKSDGWFDVYATGLDAVFWALTEANRLDEAIDVVQAARRTATTRELKRLEQLCSAYALIVSVRREDLSTAYGDHRALQSWCNFDQEKETAPPWLPGMVGAIACSEYMAKVHDYDAALFHLDNASVQARRIGAQFHEARILMAKAVLLDKTGRAKNELRPPLVRALEIGAANNLMQPFLLNRTQQLAYKFYTSLEKNDATAALREFLSTLHRHGAVRSTLLTARETQVLKEIANGLTNKEVARVLNMKEATVKFHLKKLFSKLNVTRRTQAAGKARDLGLV